MYNLVIDRGNHSTKVYVFSGDKIVKTEITEGSLIELTAVLSSVIKEYKISASILSTVLGDHRDIETGLRGNNAHVTVDTQTALPLTIKYASQDTLGTDRIAAAVGGWQLFQPGPVLVIVAGTCITYNLVDSNANFVGGAISPGLHMRLKAMHEFTGKLPLVSLDGEKPLIGHSTETSIRSGAVHGTTEEVRGMISAYEKVYPGLKTVISGGDGTFLAEALKNGIFARPDLIAEGLHTILKFNVAESLTK